MDHGKPYSRLVIMFVLHAILMYALMYAMVNAFGNAIPNLNQLYMALLMASPMLILELWLMRSMYPNKGANAAIAAIALALFSGSYLFIRLQSGIADEEFLRSMIPHHAGAILMCEKASLEDEQVQELCRNIVASQQAEIDWMKAKLDTL